MFSSTRSEFIRDDERERVLTLAREIHCHAGERKILGFPWPIKRIGTFAYSHPMDSEAILNMSKGEGPMTNQPLPIPSEQIKKLEQKIHSEKVIALLLANAKARRGF